MSGKRLKYDPFLNLAEEVIRVLRRIGPADVDAIARQLREEKWGTPSANAINKVLGDHLASRVRRYGKNQWKLTAD